MGQSGNVGSSVNHVSHRDHALKKALSTEQRSTGTEGSQAASVKLVAAQSLHSHRQRSTSSRKLCLCRSPGLCRPVTERPWCSTFNFDGSSSSLSPLQKKERTPEHQKMSKLHGILKNFACLPNKRNSTYSQGGDCGRGMGFVDCSFTDAAIRQMRSCQLQGVRGVQKAGGNQKHPINTLKEKEKTPKHHPCCQRTSLSWPHSCRDSKIYFTETLAWTQHSFKRVIWHF